MYYYDEIVIDFIRHNIVSLGLALGMLKILAKETKFSADDKIVEFLLNAVGSIFHRTKKVPTDEQD